MMNSLDNGFLRPFKSYPTYKPSSVDWLGDIPAHWEVKRLRNTVQRCQNGVWGTEPSGENDIVCVRVADFDRTGLRANMDKPTFRSIESGVIQTHSLYPGDLLLEGSGGGEKQPVGAVVLFDSEKPAVCSNFIAQLRPLNGFESRFLTYLHFTLYSARVNVRSIKQSTGIQNLDKASYLNEAAALPPLPEQRAIAAFLDRETARIDELVSRKERLIKLLQEKRTALVTRAVTQGLDPNAPMKDSGVEWLREIPAHWEVKRLKFLASMRAGAGILGTEIEDMGDYPVFGGNGIRGYTSSFTHDGEHPLIGRQGALCGVINLASGRFWATEHAVVVDAAENVETDYLTYTLIAMSLNRLAQSAAQPGLNIEVIGNVSAPLPPVPEQRAIAAFLDQETAKLDGLTIKVREAIDRLKELRTALISAAVTGRIDVREAAG